MYTDRKKRVELEEKGEKDKEGEGEKERRRRWVSPPPSPPSYRRRESHNARRERERCSHWRGALQPSSLSAPSPSSPLDLRETVVLVVTIDASPRRLWVVTSPASAVTPSSALLDFAAFESRPVTGSLPPCCGPTSN
ncbi:hypothetical protein HN51_005203 [Arachis hypogaea]|nr:uncharacterized protein DS421_4g124560 [Arachis hypogaea]